MFHSLYNRKIGGLSPHPTPHDKSEDRTFLSWPASYTDGLRGFDPEHYRLEICGLVRFPQQFSLRDLVAFTRIQQNRRLVFSDGWTFRATWEGFVVHELLHRVAPEPEGRFLIQTNLAGQSECISLKDLYNQRALFSLRVNGKNLPATHGGPLKLLVFDRYAHKGLGQIVRLELSEHEIPGHFASRGYDPSGEIEPGDYYATDLNSVHAIKTPGEVTQW